MYLFCVSDFPKEVQFQSPRTVTVSRAVEYGDSVVVACTSSPSNPPAAIRFRIYANDNLNPVQVVEPTQTVSNRIEHVSKEVGVNFPVAPLLGHSLRLDDGPGGLRRLLERVQGGHLRHEINFGDYIYRDRPKSCYVVARIFKKCRQE